MGSLWCLELPEGQATEAHTVGRWQQVLADAFDENLAIGVRRPSLIISVEPQPGLS